jgi:NhaA family Na+:H+ antiporter
MNGGILLAAMMVVAMAVANSPLEPGWQSLLDAPVAGLSVLHWINDGLMAVFFLMVALEIKREIREGELSSRAQIMLPAVAALGGMTVPALIYLAINWGNPEGVRGWAIPSATDIAFSLGVVAALGRRVPLSLRLFLTALAIIDDLGAIVIIALFYSAQLSVAYLLAAAAATVVLAVLNRLGVKHVAAYGVVGLVLWFAVLNSGIHATIAGVILGLAIPMSMVRKLEHALQPWVVFLILPVFALANSGISMAGIGLGTLMDPVFLGIAAGLFIGKQIGVFSFTWALIRLELARLPAGADWRSLYGVSVLTGIGFTMSLFIGALAFPGGGAGAETRLGVLAGSLMSALFGYVMLRRSAR